MGWKQKYNNYVPKEKKKQWRNERREKYRDEDNRWTRKKHPSHVTKTKWMIYNWYEREWYRYEKPMTQKEVNEMLDKIDNQVKPEEEDPRNVELKVELDDEELYDILLQEVDKRHLGLTPKKVKQVVQEMKILHGMLTEYVNTGNDAIVEEVIARMKSYTFLQLFKSLIFATPKQTVDVASKVLNALTKEDNAIKQMRIAREKLELEKEKFEHEKEKWLGKKTLPLEKIEQQIEEIDRELERNK